MPEQPDDGELLPEEPVSGDALAAEQEEVAAAEAAGIGGPNPDPGVDPEERAVLEGGGGYAEGFEQSEEALIRQASHEDAPLSPTADAFTPEVESDRSTAVYGEGDEIDATEVTRDPAEGDDDPGAGPGIATDR